MTALRFVGFHLHPLEKPRELRGRGHRLGSDVKRALLQGCQLAQAVRNLGECGVGVWGAVGSPQGPPPRQRHVLGMGSVSKGGVPQIGAQPHWGLMGSPPILQGGVLQPQRHLVAPHWAPSELLSPLHWFPAYGMPPSMAMALL